MNFKKNKGSEWAVYLLGGCTQECGGSDFKKVSMLWAPQCFWVLFFIQNFKE